MRLKGEIQILYVKPVEGNMYAVRFGYGDGFKTRYTWRTSAYWKYSSKLTFALNSEIYNVSFDDMGVDFYGDRIAKNVRIVKKKI